MESRLEAEFPTPSSIFNGNSKRIAKVTSIFYRVQLTGGEMKPESTSRRTVLAGAVVIALYFVGATIAWASIPQSSIRCQGCHVNPGGGELLSEYAGNQGCINCHSSGTSSTTYELDLGGGSGQTVTVPVVYYTGASAPSTHLAGGNFWWVKEGLGGDDTKGHNVFEGEHDDNFYDDSAGKYYSPGNVSGDGCGGLNSCHNNLDQTWTGMFGTRQGCTSCHMLKLGTLINGFHHADDSNIVVGTDLDDPDGFFRFLKGKCSGIASGVCGIEDDDWEATSSSADHNEYLGYQTSLNAAGSFSLLGHTMTGFCSGCHGNFHIQGCLPAQTPPCYGDWTRHPAGAVLPDAGEFEDAFGANGSGTGTYDPDVPVARPDLTGWTGADADVNLDTDLANCLSCHRAHGSPYPKMLRWDPANISEGGRCVTCHTEKVTGTVGQYHYANVGDCNVCHTAHGDGAPDYGPDENMGLVAQSVTTPTSGDKPVVFIAETGTNSLADGDATLDGICEVCHTGTDFHTNTDDGTTHQDGNDCTSSHCHPHGSVAATGSDGEFLNPGTFHWADGDVGCDYSYCHQAMGGTNNYLIKDTIETPNSGSRDVYYLADTGEDSQADNDMDGDLEWTGICEVCHTETDYHWGNSGGNHDHFTAMDCRPCHDHDEDFALGAGASGPAHATHTDGTAKGPDPLECMDCHASSFVLAEIVAAGTCDPCHSPDGAFDGVSDPDIGAGIQANWDDGVYEADGVTLKAGKEQWCAGCHDSFVLGAVIIVEDTADATFDPDGDWTSLSGYGYGGDLRYKAGGTGSATATWTPDVVQAGDYNVYAWWIAGSSRATNAPYTVYYDGGTETLRVNQKADGTADKWNLLGKYPFATGTDGSVVLSDGPGADGVVVGDAIRLELVEADEAIVDTPAAGFDPDGDWTSLFGYGYNGDLRYKAGGTGSATATWTPDVAATGTYGVYAWWIGGSSRATNAPYTIYYDGGSETVRVNQKELGTADKWNLLGTYPFAAGTDGYVVLSDGPDADGVVVGDAIRLLGGVDMGITAPNVIGDNTDYGFYVTGHKIECLVCHDASSEHIDVNHRTYSNAGGNYQAGYRLKSVNGEEPMVVPRPSRGDLYAYLDDFALCGDCHNLYEVLGVDSTDESQTNFCDDDAPLRNGHNYHLAMGGVHFDSDWDWVVDSTDTCIACHNVHGAPNQAMIRHGELMSSYGTTNKVPALNFCYLTSLSPEVCDPGAALKDCVGSKMAWDGTLATENGMCNAGCHGTKTMDRVPYLAPRVLAFPKVGRAPNNGSEVVLTAYVHDPDPSTVAGVSIDVSAIGGTSENMYDDGDTTNHGDETENDGIYSCKTTVAVDWPADWYGLTVTATDTDGTGTNDIMLEVHDPDEIIVDNPDAVADPDGDWSTLAGYGYGGDLWYKAEGTGSATVTWTPDVSIDGDYKVYAWWIEGGSRATNAPYTIYYDGGSETIGVNQKEAGTGGQWNELGTYPFPVGAFGYVVLSDGPGADGVVIADAIRLERQVP